MSNVAAGKDTDDDGEKLNDVEKALNKMGIQLRDSLKQWRNFEDVLDEVAAKWKDFAETERSQIATAIAGTRQQEMFRALMNNYEQVKTLTDVAADSAGSASKKMETYLDSVEAKTNELKATWEEFILSLNQSESWKNFLDILIWLLHNMPSVIGYITSLVVIFKGGTILNVVSKLGKGLTGLGGIFGNLKKNLDVLRLGWYRNAEGILTVASAEEVATASTAALTAGIGLLIGAITLGVQVYNSWKQAQVEAGNKAREEADGYEEKAKSMDEAIAKYQEIYNSSEDYNTKQEKLKNLSDDLVTAYGEEAKALDILNGKYENNIEAMEQAANEKRKQELASLKVSAEKGEGNLNNWTNHLYNVVYKRNNGINVSDSDKQKLQELKNLFGDDVRFVSTGHRYSEGISVNDEVTYSDLDKLYKDKYQLRGFSMKNSASNERGLKIAQTMQEYLDKNVGNLSQDVVDMITGFIAQIKSEVDKDAGGQFANKQKYQLAKVTQNDDGSLKQEIKDYEAQLKKTQELEEKVTNETNAEKKDALKKELAQEYQLTEDALNKVKALYNSGDGNQSTLSEQKILDYLGFGVDNTSKIKTNIYAGLDENQTSIYEKIRKELSETGTLSDTTRVKLADLKKELLDKDDGESWIEALNDDLALVGDVSKINLDKNNLQKEYNSTQTDNKVQEIKTQLQDMGVDIVSAANGFTDQYLERAGGNLIKMNELIEEDKKKFLELGQEMKNLEEQEYGNVGQWLTGVNASLQDIGLNVDAKWYQDLSEQLKKRRN